MITVYKRRSNVVTLGGLLLFVLALGLAWIGDHVSASLSRWVLAAFLTCIISSIVLVIAGVCYFAAAKGYSAAWGAVVLIFCTCLGWLILFFLPDRTKDHPDEPPPKIPFPQQAAKASLIAPLLSFMIGVLALPQIHGNRVGLFISGLLSTLFFIAGFILGIAALILAATRKGEGDGILVKAIVGAAFNGIFVMGMFLYVPWMLMSHRHADVQPSQTQYACHTNGVQFSYYSDWRITETPADSINAPRLTITGPNHSAVTLAFFPASDPETLEHYAHRMALEQKAGLERQVRGYAVGMTMESATGKVGGTERAGFQAHFVSRTASGSLTCHSDYFIWRDAKHKVMVSTLTADEDARIVNPGIELILNSLNIEGMTPVSPARPGAAPAKPKGKAAAGASTGKSSVPPGMTVKMIMYQPSGASSAVIGNKTVMAGDVLAGFRIVAIEKDTVAVQSPAGEKQVLRLGDSLR